MLIDFLVDNLYLVLCTSKKSRSDDGANRLVNKNLNINHCYEGWINPNNDLKSCPFYSGFFARQLLR